jgi:hypothetical protein
LIFAVRLILYRPTTSARLDATSEDDTAPSNTAEVLVLPAAAAVDSRERGSALSTAARDASSARPRLRVGGGFIDEDEDDDVDMDGGGGGVLVGALSDESKESEYASHERS